MLKKIKKLKNFKSTSSLHEHYFNRQINKIDGYEVAVVGGGISGIFTAISAAKNGAKTIIIEKEGSLGGLITLGYVPPISHQFCSKDGNLITKGLAQEFIQRLADKGGTIKDWVDWKIPKLCIDPEIFKLVTYEYITENNITVLLNTNFISCNKEGQKIKNIIVFNKSGYNEINAKYYVDCSGEADIVRSADVPCTLNTKIPKQDVRKLDILLKNIGWERPTEKIASLQFQVGNINFKKFYNYILKNPSSYHEHTRGELKEDLNLFKYLWNKGMVYFTHRDNFLKEMDVALKSGRYFNELGKWRLMKEGSCAIDGLLSTGQMIINSNRISLDPYSSLDVSKAFLDGQKACFMTWEFFKEFIPGFEKSSLIAVAPMMGIRRATQIVGKHVYTVPEREQLLEYDNVIGMTSRKIDGVNEIPFDCTVPQNIDNLLVGSGKIVSTDDLLMYRTKAHCMVIGQAVGTAAALAIKNKWNVDAINIKDLQKTLLDQGVFLGDKYRLKKLGLL